jgi:hypothetical protein
LANAATAASRVAVRRRAGIMMPIDDGEPSGTRKMRPTTTPSAFVKLLVIASFPELPGPRCLATMAARRIYSSHQAPKVEALPHRAAETR